MSEQIESNDEPKSKKRKIEKSSKEICDEWKIEHFPIKYSDEELKNISTLKNFSRNFRSTFEEKFFGLSNEKLLNLISIYWREFVERKNSVDFPSNRNDKEKNSNRLRKRKRKMNGEKNSNDSDAEFEKLLNRNEISNEKKTQKKTFQNSTKIFAEIFRLNVQTEEKVETTSSVRSVVVDFDDPEALAKAGYETEHQDFCEICRQAGEIVLCDTCPKAFHLVCLDPELEEAPEGDWSCADCVRNGITIQTRLAAAKTKPQDDDNRMKFCRVCRDGGGLLFCERCPSSYHMECLIPKIEQIPQYDWLCPRCTIAPPKYKVTKILHHRWKTHSSDEKIDVDQYFLPLLDKNVPKNVTREFFVKYEALSYWNCEWIPELSLEVYQPSLCRCYIKKLIDQNESIDFIQNETNGIDEDEQQRFYYNSKLEQNYYRNGIRPEWLCVHRILDHRKDQNELSYLVKWRDLTYDQSTWESENSEYTNLIENWKKFIEDYWKFRNEIEIEEKKVKKSKRHSTRDLDDSPSNSSNDFNSKSNGKFYEKQPNFIDSTGGTLHDYQLEGLNWLMHSFSQKNDVILADEMGLGKTVQTIVFLQALLKESRSRGPFLISAPLATIINWEREFEFWAPDMYVVTYTGDKESRSIIRQHEFSFNDVAVRPGSRTNRMRRGGKVKFHALLTSYDLICVDAASLSSIDWSLLVVDEAHRLKNNQSKFFKILSEFQIPYRVLLTGTPLQNNLNELYNLLNFLKPDKFNDIDGFMKEFSDLGKDEQVTKLHDILGSHMLRRLKTDVLKNMPSKSEFIVRVELSPLQKKYYRAILMKNFDTLNVKGGAGQTSLLNIVMELKKCSNHPYLIPAGDYEAPRTSNQAYEGSALIKSSGKLDLLSKMLKKLKEQGHRVLIFSQMTRMLDILEDFLDYFGYKYERMDGKTNGQERQNAIDRFNMSGAEQFCFLLSTRSGGLGINLATADTVIIYDSDWNPHNDIQALSRAHRIGQQNKVMIYRFVTRNSVEERITQVAKKKMMLTHLIVRPGVGRGPNLSKKELDDILRFGSEEIFKDEEENSLHGENGPTFEGKIHYDDAAIEKLVDRSQEGIQEKEDGLNEYLSSFKVASYGKRETNDDENDDETNQNFDPFFWKKILGEKNEEIRMNEKRRVKTSKNFRSTVDETNSENDDLELDEKFEVRCRKNRDEIFGFNVRERKSFLNALMRFGICSNVDFKNQWKIRQFQKKTENEIRNYFCFFLKNLSEKNFQNEIFTREEIFSRIGIMSLIRNKVQEFQIHNVSTSNETSFRFNIADGGFTELHQIWSIEENFVRDKNEQIWTRRHDYWLLNAVVVHGYSRWQQIQNDPNFEILNEPFRSNVEKSNLNEFKSKFFSKRFKLIERALIFEEQIRRAAFRDLTNDPKNSFFQLSKRFSELENLAEFNRNLSQNSNFADRSPSIVLKKILSKIDDLLVKMKNDVDELPFNSLGLPSVCESLQISPEKILSQLNKTEKPN